MPLPVDIDPRILQERPGDDLFKTIKHYLPFLEKRSSEFRKKIVALVMSDLIHDLALSKALDEVGLVLEYHAQNEGLERPTFDGAPLMRDARKLSKVRFILGYAKLLGLDDNRIEQIVKAEIDRLWSGESAGSKLPQKSMPQVLKVPDNFFDALADTTRAINEQQSRSRKAERGSEQRDRSRRAPGPTRPTKERR